MLQALEIKEVRGYYTLIPSSASRRSDCCWESASVKLLRPLNIMGSKKREMGSLSMVSKCLHTVCDHNTIFALNGFVRDGFCEINGEQHRVHLSSYRIERGFE